MIRRHSRSAIFMHWSNAVCWLFLLFSGFALLDNPYVQPIAQSWVDFWNGLVGGPFQLLNAHVIVGGIWTMLYAVYLLLRFKGEALPFLKEITDLHPASDMTWCMRKGLRLTIGEKAMRRMGMETELPAQSFYNAGQKLAAIAAVLSSLGLAVTGIIMVHQAGKPGMEELLQWCIFVHFLCAGLMAIVLPIHIYMAALAPGEGPALRSMFTGFVPKAFAKIHNPLWYKKLGLDKKDSPES